MNTKISRREALRFLALTSIASLTACVTQRNPSTPAGEKTRPGDFQVSQTPELPTAAATQPCNSPTPTAGQKENTSSLAPNPDSLQSTASTSRVLLAYFSRAGENYYYGELIQLDVGNTEVLAGMISQLIKCDVHRIEPADPYSDNYRDTVERNVREQDANARPEILNGLTSIDSYDIVLLGSPIWNVRAPMIMSTFVEGFDFTGKTIFPFTTHAGSGLGTTVRDYTASCPGAVIGAGLAVRGEEVRDAGAAVEEWLRSINLLTV